MNKVIIKGRIAVEPVQRFIRDDMSVTNFVVAVNRQFRKKEEEQKADFISVVAWNKQGEFIKNYFSKGQEIAIVGRLETDTYIDKDTQKKLTKYQVITEEVEFSGSRKEKKEETEDIEFNDVNVNVFGDDDELPF